MAKSATRRQVHLNNVLYVMGGIALLALSVWLWNRLAAGQPPTWLNWLLNLYLLLWTAPVGVAMLIQPVREKRVAKVILRLADLVFQVDVIILIYFAFLGALYATVWIVGIPSIFLWAVVASLIGWAQIPLQTALIPVFMLALLLFNYGGIRIMRFLLHQWRKPDVYSGFWAERLNKHVGIDWLLTFLELQRVTTFLYIVLALASLVAAMESHGKVALAPFSWWIAYRDIMLNVLVAFGLFEQAISKWRERTTQP